MSAFWVQMAYVVAAAAFIIGLKRLSSPKTPIQGNLRGITRQVVFDIAAKMKIETKECFLTRHEVYTADECFLTGTAAEIIPVVKVDGRVIGTGKPGAITAKLLKKFHDVTQSEGVKY